MVVLKHEKSERPSIESLNAMESLQSDSSGGTRVQGTPGQNSDVVVSSWQGTDLQPTEAIRADTTKTVFSLAEFFTHLPIIQDVLRTESSLLQDETAQECLPFLTVAENAAVNHNSFGQPCLERREHVEYIQDSLEEHSSRFTALDASRAWILYWALAGLSLLGEDVTLYRER